MEISSFTYSHIQVADAAITEYALHTLVTQPPTCASTFPYDLETPPPTVPATPNSKLTMTESWKYPQGDPLNWWHEGIEVVGVDRKYHRRHMDDASVGPQSCLVSSK